MRNWLRLLVAELRDPYGVKRLAAQLASEHRTRIAELEEVIADLVAENDSLLTDNHELAVKLYNQTVLMPGKEKT